MDPLHFCIAMGPLAVYLILLGGINLLRRPFLTTGARDAGALGIAVSGFVVAGPMELFLPEAAAIRFGPYVWLILLAFYSLCLTLLVLLLRPRLVVYNLSADQLRPILASVVADLDKDARWAGDSLVLPNLAVQLHVETLVSLRNVQLVSAGARQSYTGWRRLEMGLGKALQDNPQARNPYGFFLLSTGLIIIGITIAWMVSEQDAVAQAWGKLLGR